MSRTKMSDDGERAYEVRLRYEEEWSYIDGDGRPVYTFRKANLEFCAVVVEWNGASAVKKASEYLTSEEGMSFVPKFEPEQAAAVGRYWERGKHVRSDVVLEAVRPLRAKFVIKS